jgi:precorrin-3B synthase
VLVQQGLLPSRTHERVRNIVASPLADFAALVRALDSALCANPRMAELSGRFLFGFDDGSGDIAALVPDVLATVARPGAADVAEVVAAMLTEADQFLDARAELPKSNAWRLEDLPYGLAKLAARPVHATPPAPVGVMSADGGHHLAVLVPLGRLRTKQAHALADLAQGGNLHVTPWRSVVVPFVPDPVAAVDVAESVGLGTSAGSRWYGVSSCAGRPGCAKSLADVQADAALAEHVPGVIVHWSGCARRCGRPLNTHVDFVATGSGYERLEESA